MHMADALISPAVGATLWTASAATLAYASSRMGQKASSPAVPLMGVLGAFVFAAQMINFAIPGTGSSGHLGGGLLLAVLLGPHAAFVTMASILTVQAFFFADGGLLALGCNMFNMGVVTCYVAYPFIFKPLAGENPTPARLALACTAASVAGLQMGAACVIAQTTLSGISELPLGPFAALMLPIHLAIGLVEGVVTALVLNFVRKAQPELMAPAARAAGAAPGARVIGALALAAVVTACGLSWFASQDPDGLEWSLLGVSGKKELEAPESAPHAAAAKLQEATAVMPDYSLKAEKAEKAEPQEEAKPWPDPSAATSLAGLTGAALTLALAGGMGLLMKRRGRMGEE